MLKKEDQIVELQHRLNTIIDSIAGSVYWKDKSGVYMGCNESMVKKSNLNSKEDIIGKTDYDLWPQHAPSLQERDREVILKGKTIKAEEVVKIATGEILHFTSVKSPLRNHRGEIIGIIGNSLDITELIEAKEKAEAADKSKAEFLDNMRHDIRTPVSGIVGFSHIIKQEAKEPNVKEYADNLIASGNALLDFLNEILEAIVVSSGEVPLMKKRFDLKEKTLEIIQLNRAKAREKRLDLSLSYDDRISKYFLGDPKRIQRILLELVTNALNFTHQGYVKVTTSLANSNGREKIVKLEVEDTGIGIPKEQQEEIFLRFKRLTPAYQGIYKGAGLGLSIVKQFIDELHGEIKLRSSQEGSIFTCLIPLEESISNDQEELELTQETTIHPIDASRKKQRAILTANEMGTNGVKSKILVVEDNEISAEIATLLLSSLNCETDLAKNGETALKLFQSKPYDLIFMDIGLPDMDGYQVTQRIRALEWKSDYHIPIIALSAHTSIDHKKMCVERGMTAVLIKPLAKETAVDILNAFIPSRIKDAAQTQGTRQNELLVIKGPIIDLNQASQMGFTQKIFEDRLFPIFLQTIPYDLRALREAYQKNDWRSVQELVHKLKGGATYCGASRMKEACGRLEAYLIEGKTELRSKLYELVLTEISSTKESIEKILIKSQKKQTEVA